MYENKTERCLVPFFSYCLKVKVQLICEIWVPYIDAHLTDVWYKNQAMGVNTINTISSRMKESHH